MLSYSAENLGDVKSLSTMLKVGWIFPYKYLMLKHAPQHCKTKGKIRQIILKHMSNALYNMICREL